MADKKPRVKLVGEDGNAFAILGRCKRAAEGSTIDFKAFYKEATSGDYAHLLATVADYFEVR
jgi:hypothetical protein